MNCFLRNIGFAVVVTLLFAACGSSGRDLTYRVTGEDASRASITYTDAEGNIQEEQVDLPWETTFGINGKFDAKISVTNEDSDGSVTCQIQVGEDEKGKQTSAAYAQCVASFSIDGNSMSSSSSGTSVETYLGKAEGYIGDGELDKAQTEVEKAIEVAPNFSDVYFVQALIYQKTEELDKALAAYTHAIELDPEYVFAYNNRGQIYEAMGDLEAAIADWSTAVELDPEYVTGYFNRAMVYANLGDLEAAEADVKKVQELSDDPEKLAWAEEALKKLAPTPTPEPTVPLAQVALPSITDFEQYNHNLDCTGYNEKLLLRAFSMLYPGGSVITTCQGNPQNYVIFELDPNEAQNDAAFVVVVGNFELNPPDKTRYITEGTKLVDLFSNQLQAQLGGGELDIEADPISHQGNLVLYQDLAAEMNGSPRLMRLAAIPNFEHGQGLFIWAFQQIDTAPEEAFPAFDEITRKIITSVEFSSSQPVIGNITFATEITADSEPVDPSDSFSPGVTTIYAVFDYANFTPGMEFGFMWHLDGEEVLGDTTTWDANPTGTTWVNIDHPDGLPAGKYDVQLLIDGEVLQTGNFVIGE